MKILKEILIGVKHTIDAGDAASAVTGVSYDSRECSPGGMFFCIPGFSVDGHDFIPEALSRGASSLIVDRKISAPAGVNVIRVEDAREAMGIISANFFGRPPEKMFLIGVTGTNGKTTITYLTEAMLRKNGFVTGMLGTVENRIADEVLPVKRTTPESLDLHYLLSRMVEKKCTHAAMEVSSHAMALKRIAGCSFDAALFSNLTQDHLDFHKDIDSYFEEKKKLFHEYLKPEGIAVVNCDDARGNMILERLNHKWVKYGISNPGSDVSAADVVCNSKGIRFTVKSALCKPFEVVSPLSGKFNIYNSLAVIALGLSMGIEPESIAGMLAETKGVPGRFEKIDEGQPFTVIVDYAHSPDGIDNVLRAAREICGGRLIIVFGAGGDRDKSKRPLMGAAAARLADIAWITSDNPRSEEPIEIVDRIVEGVKQALAGIDMSRNVKYFEEVDRFTAIKRALDMAEPGDVVLIAGKGHENYQIFKDRTIHFDDREVARNILRERK